MKLIMLTAFEKFKLQGDEDVFMALNGSTTKNQSICVGEDGYIKYLDNSLLVNKIESEESELKKENKRLQNIINETMETMIMDER
jgi:hypothetical protein